MDEKKLVELITEIIIKELDSADDCNAGNGGVKEYVRSDSVDFDPSEVVIGVGPAFMSAISKTINGIPHERLLNEIMAGIEEEGLNYRIIKVLKTSDVAFIGKEAANISGSGIGIGLQSKGTAIIHQRGLDPLSNLELFPQAPLLSLKHYRQIGKNAAKYVKGEAVRPIAVSNDPMVRSAYQVRAALMHIIETECVDKSGVSYEVNL